MVAVDRLLTFNVWDFERLGDQVRALIQVPGEQGGDRANELHPDDSLSKQCGKILPTIDYAHDFNFSRGNTIKNDIPVYGQATQRLIDVCIHPTAFGKLGEHSEFAIKFTEELFSGLNVFLKKVF